jgi:hypothetical protein
MTPVTRRLSKLARRSLHTPTDQPWGTHRGLVRDPDEHVIDGLNQNRFSLTPVLRRRRLRTA